VNLLLKNSGVNYQRVLPLIFKTISQHVVFFNEIKFFSQIL